MKKIYFLIILCFSAAHSMAQDIIITNESKRIEAKVTEITDWQVSYKLWNDLDGATYLMGLSRVASIIFENGEVFVPQSQTKAEPPQKEQVESVVVQPTWEEDNFEETTLNLPSGQTVVLQSGMQLEARNGGNFYGTFKFKNSEDYLYFLKETCPAAYNEEKQANTLLAIGAIPVLVGAVMECVGIYKGVSGLINGDSESYIKTGLWIGIGFGITLVGTCFLMPSTEHSKKAQIIFNRDCVPLPRKTHDFSLSLRVAPNTAGLTLSF